MLIMLSFDTIAGLIAPVECIGCGREGDVLCMSCQEVAGEPPAARCAGCKQLSTGWRTCTSCRSWLPLTHVIISNHYSGVYEDLVCEYKFQLRRQASQPMASMMADTAYGFMSKTTILCPMPTAPARIRSRGFDHAKLLTQEIAYLTHAKVTPLLSRNSNARQLGQNRSMRLKQMQHEFSADWSQIKKLPKNAHIVLVDDVMTTGASLAAAAKTLRAAGAKNISAVVFAQAV